MEGAKVGRHTNRKRQVSNYLKRVKQFDPHDQANEQVGFCSEPTLKKKKGMPDSSLGRDQIWESPDKGQPAVVCALPANQSGAKNVQQSNSLGETVERNCNLNVEDDLPLCHLIDERKRRVHSDPGNTNLLAGGKHKFSITSMLDHSPNLMEGKMDCFDWEISSDFPTTASVDLKVAEDTIGEVQNPEVPPDNSVDIASKTEDIRQSGTKRKGYSDRGNIRMSKSRRNKFSKTSVENDLEQNLKEHNMDGEKVSTLLVAAVVNHMVEDDASCKVQNQEGPFEKTLEAVSKTEDEHDKACSTQPDTRRKRRSAQCSTLELKSGSYKSVRFRKLTNGHLDKNLMGGKLDQFIGKSSNSLNTALFNLKKVNDDSSSEVQKQAVALNKSTEACTGTRGEHDEVKKRRSDRIKKRVSMSGASTSRTSASEAIQSGDNSILRGIKNSEVRFSNGLEASSEVPNIQEELCEAEQKRKVMMHSDQQSEIKSQNGCKGVSDVTITKQLELDNTVPETSYLVSMRNERNNQVLAHNNLQSVSLFDCSKTGQNHILCCKTEPPFVDLQNVRTYHRKDKNSCDSTNNLEPGIGNGCYEVSIGCPTTLTENAEIEQINGYSNGEILGKSTSFSLGSNLNSGSLPSSRAAESSCAPSSQSGDYATTDRDERRCALAAEKICDVTVEALVRDRGTLSEDVRNDPCILSEGIELSRISTDMAEASKHPVEQICDATVEALALEGGAPSEGIGRDPCSQNQSVVLGLVSTDVPDVSQHPLERICDATVDAPAQESGVLSKGVVDDPCVQDQSVMLGCVSKDLTDSSLHQFQQICKVTGDGPALERGALSVDVHGDPCIPNQSLVLSHFPTDVTDASMVVIGGVPLYSRHMELYQQIVDRFGPFVHLESKEMKVWGHTTFVMLGEFLDTVARFMHVIHKDISEDDLEFLEIRFNKFDGFGFSVGWFQKYIAQLREMPSLDVRIREVEAQLVFAEQERDNLENQIRLSRIELGELRQRRKASVDVFGTSAV